MMTGRKTTLVLGSLAALAALAVLAYLRARPVEVAPETRAGAGALDSSTARPPTASPGLKGSWFVRYLSDPNPYLDVEVEAPPGVHLARVTADLSGPEKAYRDLPLKYNAKDSEWQTVCKFLPAKLAGGVWWVSRVRLSTRDGRWFEYTAAAPHGTYLLASGDARGATHGVRTPIWIGSFYATDDSSTSPVYYIHTFPTRGGTRSNPVLQVYAATDPVRWIAINDDPDVNQDYARVAMPLTPGETYYIRVDDRYRQRGHYAVVVSRSASPPAPVGPGRDPDRYEPDDDHRRARPISVGQVQVRSFSGRQGIWGDQDWLELKVPGATAR